MCDRGIRVSCINECEGVLYPHRHVCLCDGLAHVSAPWATSHSAESGPPAQGADSVEWPETKTTRSRRRITAPCRNEMDMDISSGPSGRCSLSRLWSL